MVTKQKTFVSGTLTHVPLRAILDDPDKSIPHRELDRDWVNDLSKDIERNGLDVPLITWNGGGAKGQQVELENGKIIPATFLVAGLHRRAAIRALLKRNPDRYKELFPHGVPVTVQGGEVKDVIAAQLRENVQRSDMPMEQILPMIKILRDEYGMKQKEIAKSIGKSDAWVSQVFDIESELGEEAVEEMKKGKVKLSKAREVAQKVKKARKSGKAVDAKAEVAKMKEKGAKLKAKGRVREEKRVSPKKVWARYVALPKIKIGARLAIAEAALGYLGGDEQYGDLPKELQSETEAEKKTTKKVRGPKKAKSFA